MTAGWSALADAQLVLAGFALLLAAQQASVWHWEGPRSSARLMVFTSLATAAVFALNDAVLQSLGAPAAADRFLFGRSAALALLGLLTLPLAGAVTGWPPPRWLLLALLTVSFTRLALWPGTDLISRHRLHDGVPAYGPLMAPTGLAIIVLVFGYLCVSIGRGPSDRERILLTVGLVMSLMLAVFTVVSGAPLAAEVMSGYVPFPALVAIAAMLWTRQLNAFRTVRRLADRQRALAGLGSFALAADLQAVSEAADRALADVDRRGPGDPEDREFVAAVGSVVAAARGQHRANEELRRRATTDELTGLANRPMLLDLINRALNDEAAGSTVAVALCDIDRFRSVNNVHGHPAGDEVLRELARRLTALARRCDVVGRFGGDEFVVVCTDANVSHDVEELGHRLSAAFERPIVTEHVDASVTASIGIVTATSGCGPTDADTLLRDADTAMYDAKARGGGVIGQFHDGLRSAVVYRADLERRLIGAVDRGEIVVHYQPILRLPDRRIVGFEALARWQQGEEMLPPDQWIPIAESTALIHEIGEHVLVQAVKQLEVWLAQGHDISMSVNVSPRQLSSRRFPAVVRRCLSTGVPAARIALEVTESLAVDEHAAGILSDLRRAGVRIALDDFGTGYSALAAVSRLPIDILKVDRAITRRSHERDGQAVLAAVLAIATSLQLRTVAEGVETAEQEATLAELGCELVQGFLYSRPVDAASAGSLLPVTVR
ncbi:MAG: putative diguanylate cyclase/phosphodiesterase [Frankiales bacterium]|nr:putative diguanylate cyclase/phosphodiesterase [Frankiales bacterium]